MCLVEEHGEPAHEEQDDGEDGERECADDDAGEDVREGERLAFGLGWPGVHVEAVWMLHVLVSFLRILGIGCGGVVGGGCP